MHLLIIANPFSGGRRGREVLGLVHPILDKADREMTVRETTHQGHAAEMASELDLSPYDAVGVIGGDGTISEVINGLMQRPAEERLPIGIFPGGSGNSLCHDLDLARPEEAAHCILEGRQQDVDLMKYSVPGNDKPQYAFNILGWGLVTDIGFTAHKLRWLGESQYTLATLIDIFRYRPRQARIILDGKELSGDFVFIIANNTVHTGKKMKMAPKARIDDGKFDVILVRHIPNRFKLLQVFPKIFTGEHIHSELVEYHQVQSFELIPEKSESLNIDGEIFGSTPLTVNVVPHAFQVFVRK